MHNFNYNKVPNIFYAMIEKPQHKYPTALSLQFLYVDQSCGTMFFIKKKRMFNLIYFFRVNLIKITLD